MEGGAIPVLVAGGPSFCKRAGWVSHRDRASKQHPSVASASASAPRLLPFLSGLLQC